MVLPKKNTKHWIQYIVQRIRRNKNMLIFISGATGSGKSLSSIRIAQELSEELKTNFNIDHIVFSAKELMELINSGKLKPGSVVIFEEAGVGLSHKNWQSVINKCINYLMQTFRHKNFILIFNSPYMDFCDASIRRLFHAELRTIAIDYKKKQCKLNAQFLKWDSRMQKFYYRYLRIIKPGNPKVKIWRVDLPSKDMIKQYEKKKIEYTTKLNRDILDEINRYETQKKPEKKGVRNKMYCGRCKYKWLSQNEKIPKRCANCNSKNVSIANENTPVEDFMDTSYTSKGSSRK